MDTPCIDLLCSPSPPLVDAPCSEHRNTLAGYLDAFFKQRHDLQAGPVCRRHTETQSLSVDPRSVNDGADVYSQSPVTTFSMIIDKPYTSLGMADDSSECRDSPSPPYSESEEENEPSYYRCYYPSCGVLFPPHDTKQIRLHIRRDHPALRGDKP